MEQALKEFRRYARTFSRFDTIRDCVRRTELLHQYRAFQYNNEDFTSIENVIWYCLLFSMSVV